MLYCLEPLIQNVPFLILEEFIKSKLLEVHSVTDVMRVMMYRQVNGHKSICS